MTVGASAFPPFPAAAVTVPVFGAKQALLLHPVPGRLGGGTAAVTGPRWDARAGQVMPSGLCRAGGRQLSGAASSSSTYSKGIGPMPGGRFGAT